MNLQWEYTGILQAKGDGVWGEAVFLASFDLAGREAYQEQYLPAECVVSNQHSAPFSA